MPNTITKEIATEYRTHCFIAEASDIGLPPGDFPRKLETTLGNGHPFRRLYANSAGVHYEQIFGCLTLVVLNDYVL